MPGEWPKPDVSVIVPCHNVADTVSDTIKTILAQTHENWEAICIDDASADETSAVLADWAKQDSRILTRSYPHGGPAVSRNRGIKLARAERVFFLDADDLLRPHALACLLNALSRAKTEAGARTIVTGGYELLDQQAKPLSIYHFPTVPRFTVDTFLLSNRIPPMTLVPMSVLGEKPFDEVLPPGSEDWDLWLRLANAGVRCVTIPNVLYGYRLRSNSLSHSADTLYASARVVLDRWMPKADDADRVRDVRHRMAVHCGAIALASGHPEAIWRYVDDLPSVRFTDGFPMAAASSIHKAFQFVHGAKGETWQSEETVGQDQSRDRKGAVGVRHNETTWLDTIQSWLAEGPFSTQADSIFDSLKGIVCTPQSRVDHLCEFLARRADARRLLVYGLGTNGLSLLEHLRSNPNRPAVDIHIADDHANQHIFDTIGLPRDNVDTWRSWPKGTVAMVTPNDYESMRDKLACVGGIEGTDFLILASEKILARPAQPAQPQNRG